MADQLTFDDLKSVLKKFKLTPATGHGSVHIELADLDVEMNYGKITMVKITTKNVVEKEKEK